MKTLVYTLIVAVVVIGGWFILKNTPKQDSQGGNPPNVIEVSKNGDINGEYALKDIISIDEPYLCKFEREDGDSKVSGEIFIAAGAKVRGNFKITSTATPTPFESSFIMNGGNIYSWTSLLNFGFKSPISENASSTDSSLASVNEKIKYDCSVWKPDQTKFELPAGIIFRDKIE